nr:NADH dehydrogenase subunit 2 [Meteorus sp. 1 XHS-2023a]
MNFKYNMMMFFILIVSPLMVISVNSMISVWVNMEMNLMMFLLMMILNNVNIYDSSMKYFLMSSFSSSVFILVINLNYYFFNNFFLLVMNLSMFMKLGVFPFYYWFIDLMTNLNWLSCLILSTWQKLIPLYILMNVFNKMLLYLVIFMNGLLSVFYGMNQVNMKKIMGYSSINHMSWMLMSLILSINMWFYYFILYTLFNLLIMLMLNKLMILNLMDFYGFYDNYLKYYFMYLFMSLGGLPPFFGFSMKWYFIFEAMIKENVFIMMFLLFYSFVYLYYYIRVIYMTMIMNYDSVNFFNSVESYNNNNKNLMMMMSFLMILSLLIITVWFMY